jgi:hypothetical protein
MPTDLEILKRLILLEAEGDEVDTTEGAEEEDAPEEKTPEEEAPKAEPPAPKPGTFEDDPMSFILKKYVTLNQMMEELMTPDFKEYVDGIFIVAPKPTTFKVLLHNGQYFFLTYLGKAYQSTIEGRNYYLVEIGEKERAMVAISRLLRYGSPLKTKGPEGAEQDTRPEDEGGGDAGGGEEAGPVDTTAGAEELEEAFQRRLVKMLLEAKKSDEEALISYVASALTSQGMDGKRLNKNGGPHIRGVFPQNVDTVILNSILPGAKMEIVAPGEIAKGARSDSYDTMVFTLGKSVKDEEGNVINKGTRLSIINQIKAGKSSIKAKSLTPDGLGLSGYIYEDAGSIQSDAKQGLNSVPGLDKTTKKFIESLMTDVISSPQKYEEVSDITDTTTTIKLSNNTKKLITSILPGDIDIIGKDFGEILGAILMASEVNIKKGVEFPSAANNPLVDFYVDDYGISSKYKQGAAATLSSIISGVDEATLSSKAEKAVYTLFSSAFKKGVSDSYLEIAKKVNPPALEALSDALGIPKDKITLDAIVSFITKAAGKLSGKKEDPTADAKIKKALGAFFTAANSQPQFPIRWQSFSSPQKVYGIVIGPLAKATADAMNANKNYQSGLKTMISKMEVKQLYMDVSIKSNVMTFKLKSFSDPNANFDFTPSNISVYNPDNGKMGFKMK